MKNADGMIPRQRLRPIVVVANGHPEFTTGGAELVAYNSFRDLVSRRPGSIFIGGIRHREHLASLGLGQRCWQLELRPSEWVFDATTVGVGFFINENSAAVKSIVDTVLRVGASAIHFHHYWGVGVNVISALRSRVGPDQKLVLTLHEFMAMCLNLGQMVRTDNRTLCRDATLGSCQSCFPDFEASALVLRRNLMRQMISTFDEVTAPSEFLARRYNSWLGEDRVKVIRNGIDASEWHAVSNRGAARRFAMFSQATRFKGADCFLAAAMEALTKGCDAHFSIYGWTLNEYQQTFPDAISISSLSAFQDRIEFHGAYRNDDIELLMSAQDWIIIPSVWWENAPLVVLEALRARRPVIASDIGGLAESVGANRCGVLFRAGCASALTEMILLLAGNVELWTQLRRDMSPARTTSEMNLEFEQLYEVGTAE